MTYLSFTQLLHLNVAGKFDSFAQSLNFLRQNRDNNSIHAPIKAKTMPTLIFSYTRAKHQHHSRKIVVSSHFCYKFALFLCTSLFLYTMLRHFRTHLFMRRIVFLDQIGATEPK